MAPKKIDESEIDARISETMWDASSGDPLTKERGKCLLDNCEVRDLMLELRECTKRVMKKIDYTAETCTQELIELVEAIDHCVKNKAFANLK